MTVCGQRDGFGERGGEVGTIMRSFDWSASELGAPATWPATLRGYVAMVLELPTPAIIFWGPNQTQLYNDGYAAIMGPRHPKYLAGSYRDCWPDTYPVIYPWMQKVLNEGETIEVKNQLFTLTRHGFPEEAYFTFTFSPLRDDEDRIAGIFQPVVEVTESVLAARRTEMLDAIASQVDSPHALTEALRRPLEDGAKDVPFALMYVASPDDGGIHLTSWAGFDAFDPAAMGEAEVSRIAREVFESGEARVIDEVGEALGRRHVGVWGDETRVARALPLRRSPSDVPRGVVIVGLSPRLRFDGSYQNFVEILARELAAIVAALRAKEVERDLLDREREARKEAELQKEHLASLFMQAPTPICVLSGKELIVELANPAMCDVWIRRPEEVRGRPLLEAIPELRGQGFDEVLRRVLNEGERVVGRESPVEFVRSDGSRERKSLTFVHAPLRTTRDRVDGVLVIGFDVTDQVRAREQIDQLRTAAEAANEAKDEFFAILGHELRNPLAPILTALELLRMRDVKEAERERSILERQAEHLVRLVDDLLDVSRITRGKIDLSRAPVEAHEIVQRAVEMALPILEQRQHQLFLDVPKQGLAVDADATRLAQSLANLLTNAAKYTPPGGRIGVKSYREDDQVVLAVRDNGIGIDPEFLPRLFDAFVQSRQSLDRSQGGLGLGLAIVRGIVEMHGGSVDVRSEGRGLGSEFVVRLPSVEGSPPSVDRRLHDSDPARRPAEHGRRILLVDDNHDAADLLALSLEKRGHRVQVAYDAPSALRAVRDRTFDVALLDIGLPVMDGYELADRLRSIPELDALRLVAITGYGQESDRERTAAAGFDAHLVKPVTLAQVDAVISELT